MLKKKQQYTNYNSMNTIQRFTLFWTEIFRNSPVYLKTKPIPKPVFRKLPTETESIFWNWNCTIEK